MTKDILPLHRSPLFLILSIIIVLTGCGKKQWPKADLQEDTFIWQGIETSIQDNCLLIQTNFKGEIKNLSQLILLLEERDQACTVCPFQPTKQIVFTLPCPQIQINGQKANIYYSPVNPEENYRIQLIAVNIFSQLPPQRSPVVWNKN